MTEERSIFLDHWIREAGTTRRVLERIPEGSDYRPDPKSRTAEEIAWQMAAEEKMIVDAVESGKFSWPPPPMPATMAEIVDTYVRQNAELAERWRALPQERWDGTVEMGGRQRPASAMAWSFFFDIIHHRGQITTYLRPMGSTVPQVYGPSGDEP